MFPVVLHPPRFVGLILVALTVVALTLVVFNVMRFDMLLSASVKSGLNTNDYLPNSPSWDVSSSFIFSPRLLGSAKDWFVFESI